MNTAQIVSLALIGLMAGLTSGALGVGGAIIIVPALVFFLGMTQHQAQGTSLAVLLFPVGLLAVMNYHKGGFINFKFAIVLMLAFFVGSYFGSLASLQIPAATLKKAFGVLMLLVGVKMVFFK